MRKAKPIDYRPSPAELWELSSSVLTINPHASKETQTEEVSERLKVNKRLEIYIEKLLEFNHLQLNPRGYFCNGQMVECITNDLKFRLADYLSLAWERPAPQETLELSRANIEKWAREPNVTNWTLLNSGYPTHMSASSACPITDYTFRFDFDGVTFTPTKMRVDEAIPGKKGWADFEKCWIDFEDFPYADGHFPRQSYDIEVPTGLIAFGQTFWKFFDDKKPKATLNSEKGRIKFSKLYEAQNCWNIFSPSCGIGLFQEGTGLLVTHRPEEPEDPERVSKQKNWKYLGEIPSPTDLRWFYGCDRSLLPEKCEERMLLVPVKPGRYRLTNNYEHEDFTTTALAEIKRI